MTNEQAQELLGEIAGYLETLRKDPHSTIFVPLSDAYRKLGMLEEALSTALRGVEALPFFGPGYVVLGRTQMKYGELGRACQSFHKALEVDPASIAALKNLAKLYVLQGDRDHASSFLARAVELSPDDLVLANLYKSLRPAVVETDSPVTDEDGISSDCASQRWPTFMFNRGIWIRRGIFTGNCWKRNLKINLSGNGLPMSKPC
jgi:tetratricopeptide (TPR) repeat protein